MSDKDNGSLGIGTDGEGNVVTIGDTDSMGYKVGYIDDTGLAWESRLERDSAVFDRVYDEATNKQRTDVLTLLNEAEVLEENRGTVLTNFLNMGAIRELKNG
jgi:hypothetical protein